MVAVVTLGGFNEVDSFVASYLLGRVNLARSGILWGPARRAS
jgi:hypothetical protein